MAWSPESREDVVSVAGDRGPQFLCTSPSLCHLPHRDREAEATAGTAAENSHSMRRELLE